jgi:predicted nucleotide-binding protein
MSHVKPDDDYNNNVHDREKRWEKVNQNLISCESLVP